jgi:hypothetical protein
MDKKIREGRAVDLFGLEVPDWAAHIMKNIRLFNELDKMNPYGAFTGVGNYLGNFEGDRPNRVNVSGAARALAFTTGLRVTYASEEKTIKGEAFALSNKLGEVKKLYNRARREGDTANMQRMEAQAKEIHRKLSDLNASMNDVRLRKAAQQQQR